SHAKGSVPSSKWLNAVDPFIDIIGSLNFFIRLLHWLPLVVKQLTSSTHRHGQPSALLPANIDILKGLIWLCSASDDPEIARALSVLAVSSYGAKLTKIGHACIWALGLMPSYEGIVQLNILKRNLKTRSAQKIIAGALEIATEHMGMSTEAMEGISVYE